MTDPAQGLANLSSLRTDEIIATTQNDVRCGLPGVHFSSATQHGILFSNKKRCLEANPSHAGMPETIARPKKRKKPTKKLGNLSKRQAKLWLPTLHQALIEGSAEFPKSALKRLSKIKGLENYASAMKVLESYSERKLFKVSEFTKSSNPKCGGILNPLLLEAASAKGSGENYSEAFKERRLLHQTCERLGYSAREYILKYFFTTVAHLATIMGQFHDYANENSFESIAAVVKRFTETLEKDIRTWKFEEEVIFVNRRFLKDGWTIVSNTIGHSLIQLGKKTANDVLEQKGLENVMVDGTKWATFSIREMGLWVLSKMEMKIPVENVTERQNMRKDFLSAVLPLLNKLREKIIPLLECNHEHIPLDEPFMRERLDSSLGELSYASLNLDAITGKLLINLTDPENKERGLSNERLDQRRARAAANSQEKDRLVNTAESRFAPALCDGDRLDRIEDGLPPHPDSPEPRSAAVRYTSPEIIDVDNGPLPCADLDSDGLPPYADTPETLSETGPNSSPPEIDVDTGHIASADLDSHGLPPYAYTPETLSEMGRNASPPEIDVDSGHLASADHDGEILPPHRDSPLPMASRICTDSSNVIEVINGPRPHMDAERGGVSQEQDSSAPLYSTKPNVSVNLSNRLKASARKRQWLEEDPNVLENLTKMRENRKKIDARHSSMPEEIDSVDGQPWYKRILAPMTSEIFSLKLFKRKDGNDNSASPQDLMRYLCDVMALQVSGNRQTGKLQDLPCVDDESTYVRHMRFMLLDNLLKESASRNRNIQSYISHMEQMARLELYGEVLEALAPLHMLVSEALEFLPIRRGKRRLRDQFHYFETFIVTSCDGGELHIETNEESPYPSFTTHTLCMAVYWRGGNNSETRSRKTNTFLCYIRKCGYRYDDPDYQNKVTGQTIKIMMHPRIYNDIVDVGTPRSSRAVFNLTLVPVLNLSNSYSKFILLSRMNDDSYQSEYLPEKLQNIFFDRNRKGNTEDNKLEPDQGSLGYLKTNFLESEINDGQFEALENAIGNIGRAENWSSSLTLIQGPPGTGKSYTIVHLIGSLLHHSTKGHSNGAQINYLKKRDKKWRYSGDTGEHGSLRVLVAAPSNQGVSEIYNKVSNWEYDDMNGGRLKLQCVRLASKTMLQNDGIESAQSIQRRAKEYEQLGPDWWQKRLSGRKYAHILAQRAMARECVAVFTTTSMLASRDFAQLRTTFDVLIIDEAAQCDEIELHSAIMATYLLNFDFCRCHLILVGDHCQLPPHSYLAMYDYFQKDVRTFSQLTRSTFERLVKDGRAHAHMLTQQFRQDEDLAVLHSAAFYDGRVKSVKNRHLRPRYVRGPEWKHFNARDPWFLPLVFVDTSKLPVKFRAERRDANNKKVIYNTAEAELVRVILRELYTLLESEKDWQKKVSLLTAYTSQKVHLRKILEQDFPHIHPATVDSIQGAENEIVILSCTRSNQMHKIGFLGNMNRLNVSCSRVKKLLIIIGDSTTLMHSRDTHGHVVHHKLQSYIEKCRYSCTRHDCYVRFYARLSYGKIRIERPRPEI